MCNQALHMVTRVCNGELHVAEPARDGSQLQALVAHLPTEVLPLVAVRESERAMTACDAESRHPRPAVAVGALRKGSDTEWQTW